MIRLITAQNLVTPGVQAGELDTIFNGSCATQCEEGFIQIARTDLCKFFAQLTTRFSNTVRSYIANLLHLPYNGFGYALVSMTNVYIHQAAGKINVTFIIIIIEVNALPVLNSNWRNAFLFAPGKERVLHIVPDNLLAFGNICGS